MEIWIVNIFFGIFGMFLFVDGIIVIDLVLVENSVFFFGLVENSFVIDVVVVGFVFFL